MPKDNAPATPALNKTPDCDAELYQKSPDEMAKILERRESESGEDETSGGVPRGRVSLGRGSRGSGARRPPPRPKGDQVQGPHRYKISGRISIDARNAYNVMRADHILPGKIIDYFCTLLRRHTWQEVEAALSPRPNRWGRPCPEFCYVSEDSNGTLRDTNVRCGRSVAMIMDIIGRSIGEEWPTFKSRLEYTLNVRARAKKVLS